MTTLKDETVDQVRGQSESDQVKRSPSKSPLKNLQSKSPRSPVKNLQSRSPVKKIFETDDVNSTDKTKGPVIKIQTPAKARSVEAFGDSETQVTDIDSLQPGLTSNGPAGDATPAMPVLSPRKSPKPPARVYRMVCQCGAKNCRKFVF